MRRKLGASGIEVSPVGLGAWAIGGWMWGGTDEQKSIAAIQASLDAGVNLIDTAPAYGYGRSEEIIGRAIHGRRDQVVLATKCGLIWDREEGQFFFHANEKGATSEPSSHRIFRSLRPESIRQELEQSLRRLKTDYIDLYQTHWQDATTPVEQTMSALLDLKAQGKIRAIGVSNASREQIEAYGPIDSDQERYSLLDRAIEDNGVLPYCRQQNIAVLAYSPFAHGLLTGKLRPGQTFPEGDLRRSNPRFTADKIQQVNDLLASFAPIAQHHGATLGQLIIAWTFSQPGVTCALCGARDAAQAVQNSAAMGIELSEDELRAIGAAAAALRTS